MTDWLKELDNLSPISKKSEVSIHLTAKTDKTNLGGSLMKPFHFITNDGEGTYLSYCQTVDEARSELEKQFLNKLVTVTLCH